MNKSIATLTAALFASTALMAADWNVPSANDYQDHGAIYVKLQMQGKDFTYDNKGDLELAAFIGESCRGYANEAITMGSKNQQAWQLDIYGNDSDLGRIVNFRARYQGVEYTFNAEMPFSYETVKYPDFVLDLYPATSYKWLTLADSYTLSSVGDSINLYYELKVGLDDWKEHNFSELPSKPELMWTNDSQSSSIEVAPDGMVVAKASTTAKGAKVTVSVPGSNLSTTTTFYVLPLAYDVYGFRMDSQVDVDRNATVDLKEHLYMQLITGYLPNGAPDITEQLVDAATLAEYDVVWAAEDQSCFNLSSNGIVTPTASTDPNGKWVAVTISEKSDPTMAEASSGKKYDAGTYVRVTPFKYKIAGVSITENPITLSLHDTLSMLDLLEFSVVIDTMGHTAIKHAYEIDVPALSWSAADTTRIRVVKNVLHAEGRTLAAGVTLAVTIPSAMQPTGAPVKAQTQVIVTPVIIPLEGIKCSVNQIRMTRLADASFEVQPLPANADFDASLLVMKAVQMSVTGAMMSAEGIYVSAADSSNTSWNVSAESIGDYNIQIAYDGEVKSTLPVFVGAATILANGWNWFSPYALNDSLKTPDALNAALGGHLSDLRSQTSSTYNDPEYGFFGQLKGIGFEAYKAKLTEQDTLVVFNGSRFMGSADVYKGYTWLYYPYQYDYALDDMTGMLQAPLKNGDRIISQADGFVEYYDGSWNGTLTTLRAGQSYLLYCQTNTGYDVIGIYNWANESAINATPVASGAKSKAAHDLTWKCDAHAYADVMTIVGKLEGRRDMNVAAMVDGECRGVAQTVTIGNEDYYFITVHGKAGERISFIAFADEEEYQLETTATFSRQAGSIEKPVDLGTVDSETSIVSLSSDELKHGMVFDLNGNRISSLESAPAGAYLIRKAGRMVKVIK